MTVEKDTISIINKYLRDKEFIFYRFDREKRYIYKKVILSLYCKARDKYELCGKFGSKFFFEDTNKAFGNYCNYKGYIENDGFFELDDKRIRINNMLGFTEQNDHNERLFYMKIESLSVENIIKYKPKILSRFELMDI